MVLIHWVSTTTSTYEYAYDQVPSASHPWRVCDDPLFAGALARSLHWPRSRKFRTSLFQYILSQHLIDPRAVVLASCEALRVCCGCFYSLFLLLYSFVSFSVAAAAAAATTFRPDQLSFRKKI